jgi:hypothetical protein
MGQSLEITNGHEVRVDPAEFTRTKQTEHNLVTQAQEFLFVNHHQPF